MQKLGDILDDIIRQAGANEELQDAGSDFEAEFRELREKAEAAAALAAEQPAGAAQ